MKQTVRSDGADQEMPAPHHLDSPGQWKKIASFLVPMYVESRHRGSAPTAASSPGGRWKERDMFFLVLIVIIAVLVLVVVPRMRRKR
jgi:hypothetical protein